MWEYKRFNYEFNLVSEIDEKLNELGKEGWEIISYQEEKPKKFGDSHKSSILMKKEISKIL